ncbi:MAG: vWA domain-containing protein [Elainellaceae cyanobacterium]
MPTPNPPFPGRCGLDVVIALDSSNSMGPDNFDRARQAAADFAQALVGTPSRVGFVIFSTNTKVLFPLTDVSTVERAAEVAAALNDYEYVGEYTNWAAAFNSAQSLKPELIILCTDGAPFLPDNQAGAEQAAFAAADRVRQVGTRVIAIGIGTRILPENLRRVSGAVLNDDYYLTNFDGLGDRLREIALRACGGSITVTKRVEQLDGTYAPAEGWAFKATLEESNRDAIAILPPESTTEGDGLASFSWQVTRPVQVTITEETQPGFTPGVITCSRNGEAIAAVATPGGAAAGRGVTLKLNVNDVIECESRSRPNYQMLVSTSADRRSPRPLSDATVGDDIYAFLDHRSRDTGDEASVLSEVQFGLDAPRGEPGSLERFAPYDFAGGGTPTAFPFDTRTVANGPHTIYAELRFKDGTVQPLAVPFTVDNQPLPYRLLVSSRRDRRSPRPLAEAEVNGEVYIFFSADQTETIDSVRFGLDSRLGEPSRLESRAPYDFAGGRPAKALPFDTRTVDNGPHTIETEITFTDGTVEDFTTPFIISNP